MLVYIVVLNLFIEFADAIVIESFWISILTAVLLKGLLDIVVGLEHRVGEFFELREGTLSRVLTLGAKSVILEVADLVFGERVELGHAFDILVLIFGMMAARAIVHRIYLSVGETDPHDS